MAAPGRSLSSQFRKASVDKSGKGGNGNSTSNSTQSNPHKNMRDIPAYFLEGPWAPYLDLETLRMQLNQKDINFAVDTENGELVFSNPGHSRAVIDISYCLNDDFPDVHDHNDSCDHENGSEGGDSGSGDGSMDDPSGTDGDGGVVVVVDPCDALTCGEIGL